MFGTLVPRSGIGTHDMDNSKCVILTPIATSPELTTDISISVLSDRGYAVRRIYGNPYLDMVRSVMAHRALQEGFEELMWIDSDVTFKPEAVDRLRSHDLPIVCGIYPLKQFTGGIAATLFEDQKVIGFGSIGGLIEIKGAGTGFLYTKREVYETIVERFELPLCSYDNHGMAYPYFQNIIHKNGRDHYSHMGEDLSFSIRARECGYKIMADTVIRLGHIGKYEYSWEDMAGRRPRGDGFELKFL